MRRRMLALVIVLALGLGWLPPNMAGAQDVTAATVIADFNAEGALDDWWSYVDDLPETTLFRYARDTDVVAEGAGALRMELDIAAGGYAGMGFDYGLPHDWTAGQGIVLRIRASEEGLPLVFVLHVVDPTQTSGLSPGLTPFNYRLTTPAGCTEDWVTVTLPWNGFERAWWVGKEGITEFTPNPIAKVEIGYEAPKDARLQGTIWVDDIRVISEENLNEAPSFDELIGEIPPLHVSQIGYRPEDRKVVVASVPFERFQIVDEVSGEVVYTGKATRWGYDEDADQEIYWGRFHSLQTPGRYRVVVEGVGESAPFVIAEDAFDEAVRLAARAFYLHRSGVPLHDAESGLDLEAGHTQAATLWDDRESTLDVHGGWYDAGDYGRYMPTGAFAVGQLLLAYRANPDFFADGSLNIPESGNGVPDLLDEVRWELEWMLRMQREDGAVYHKVTTREYPALGTLPAEDRGALYVFGPTSADTAFFAGAMAQAAQTFAPYDAEFAQTCLDAAQQAWAWLEKHPEQVPAGGFRNPPPSEFPMGGGYDLYASELGHRLWAAGALFQATGDRRYEDAFAAYLAQMDTHSVHTMTWADGHMLGLFAYLNADNASPETWQQAAAIVQDAAQHILEVTFRSGYGVALHGRSGDFAYVWGSNQVALAHGLHLMLTDALFPDPRYEHAARAQVQYIFGVNPLGKMYFTGLGANPVEHPHHNVSYHFRQAVPGWVGEGANGAIEEGAGGDAVLEALWAAGVPTALCYKDDWQSWATNEPTIDANASFVALASYFAH